MNTEAFEESILSKEHVQSIMVLMEAYCKKKAPGFSSDCKEYGYFLRKKGEEAIYAGIIGWSWMGSMHIHRLFVPEELWRQGIGTSLLTMTEKEGRRRGCSFVTTETLSIQNALPFYLKHGYSVAFHDEGYSLGMSIYYLRKKL
jgi:GNAT superfamily N-acetyltransferase